jgi:hypothetical protein
VLGVTVYLLLFLQNGIGLGATAAGAVLIAAGMWTPLLSRRTGRLADCGGARRPVSVGLFTAALGLAAVALAVPTRNLLLIVPGLMLFGISRPFVFTPASAGAMKALPASQRGLASGLIAESRQLGAVLGVAALGSLAATFAAPGRPDASGAGLQAVLLGAAVVSLIAAAIVAMAYSTRPGGRASRHGSARPRKAILLASALAAITAAILAGTGTALASPPGPGHDPAILAPADGSLETGSTVLVRVRSDSGFTALLGSNDVTKNFGPPQDGVRTAVLHLGADVNRGFNRLVVTAGVGTARRYRAVSFTVGRRAPGMLHVATLSGSPAGLHVAVGERGDANFSQLQITLNGRTVRSEYWVVGLPNPSTVWPFARKSFQASFGADEGTRSGLNRLTITAWNQAGTFDRVTVRARVGAHLAVAAAGQGQRTSIHQLVVLDGRATRTWGGAAVRYRWSIVSAPAGSRAHLMRADTARPALRPDRPGRYLIQLMAWPQLRHSPGPDAFTAATATADTTTVEATPPTPPIGVPISTLTSSGGIDVGGQPYSVPSGTWAQVLVLDRQTLQVISDEPVGRADAVTDSTVKWLVNTIQDQNPSTLVVVSGGGRAAPGITLGGTMAVDLATMVGSAGGSAQSVLNQPTAWWQSLRSGSWSIVGVPGIDNSATSNLFGLDYGLYAGNASAPGALTGYLQPDNFENYTFVSGQYTSIDTQPPNTPQGQAEVKVGAHTYQSNPSAIPSGGSGFYLLVFDSTLHDLRSSTYYTNTGRTANPAGVQALAQALFSADQTPGHLVVVQSINAPTGSTSDWDNDGSLATDRFGTNQNVPIPQNDSTWGTSSLVAALGAVGGPMAHDQVAHMVTPAYAQPNPSYGGQGYTLVASTGSAWDPSAAPLSRSQAGSGSTEARVVGLLERSRQGLWTVHDPSSGTGPYNTVALAELAYQPPIEWPLSQTQPEKNVLRYLQGALGFEFPIRAEYANDSDLDWGAEAAKLQAIDYPGAGKGFDATTFAAVKAQVYNEMLDVALVNGLFNNWSNVFSTSTTDGLVDLQSIGKSVVNSVPAAGQSQTTGDVLATTGESLWVASTVFSLFGQEEVAGPLGLAACLFDLGSDVVADTEGSPDGGPITADVSQLAVDFADRYAAIQTDLGHVRDLMVSDWGKLQQAAANTTGIWSFNTTVQTDMIDSLENSAQREFWTAILPVPYVEYAVDSPFLWSESQSAGKKVWDFPWQVECTSNSYNFPNTKAFGNSMLANLSSWETTPVRLYTQPIAFDSLDWFGLTEKAAFDYGQGTITSNHDTVSQSLTKPLFEPVTQGGLGMDKVAFFAAPQWQHLWFYCQS